MPRARFIDPHIMADADFAELPRDCRLFFVYVLTLADDAGNFPDDSRELKVKTFPYDDDILNADIVGYLRLLQERTMYLPYTLGGRIWYHIRNFHKYQRPEKPTQPKHPLYPGQKYTFWYREQNKWMKKTVIADEWNMDAYQERTTKLREEVGREEVRTLPTPTPSTPSPETEKSGRQKVAPSAPPAGGIGATSLAEKIGTEKIDPAYLNPLDPDDLKIIDQAKALNLPVGKKTPRATLQTLIAAKTPVDFTNPTHYAMVKTLDTAGINTDHLETLHALTTAFEQHRIQQTGG